MLSQRSGASATRSRVSMRATPAPLQELHVHLHAHPAAGDPGERRRPAPPAVRACHPYQHAARRSKPVGAMLSRRSGAPATRSRVSMRATPDPLHGSRPPSMLTPRRATCGAVRTRPRAAVRACHPRKHANLTSMPPARPILN